MEKPKRPLSSFNLFYRYKRSLLASHLAGQGEIPKEAIQGILACPPGSEDELLQSLSTQEQQHQQHFIDSPSSLSPGTNELRREKIRTALEGKVLPSYTAVKRRHRKAADGPSLSFVEMGQLMTESWKSVDPYAKKVFDELAEEGRACYRDAMKEYKRVMHIQGDEGAVGRGEGTEGIVMLQRGGHQSRSKKKTATKKVKACKVARNSKKKPPSSMDTSPPERSMNDDDEDLRLHMESVEPSPVIFDERTEVDASTSMLYQPRKKANDLQRRHSCPNPEDISRLWASEGIGPMPLTTSLRAPSLALASSQPWLHPPTSFQPQPSPWEELGCSIFASDTSEVKAPASARPRNYFRRASMPISSPMNMNKLQSTSTPRNYHINLNPFVCTSLKFSPNKSWPYLDNNDTQLPFVTPTSRCFHNTYDVHLPLSHSDPAMDSFRWQDEERVDPFDNFHPIDQHTHDVHRSSSHPDPALDLCRQQVEEKVNDFTFTQNNKARSIQVGDIIVDQPMDLFDEADSLGDQFDSDFDDSLV